MTELVTVTGVSALVDGVIVVGFVLLLAIVLSFGYAVLERYLSNRIDRVDHD